VLSQLRHRHALRQAKAAGIDREVTLRPAVAAVDLQQLPLPDEVADRHRLEAERPWLAPAPGLVPIPLDLHQFGKPGDQLGDAPRLVNGEPLFRDGNCVVRLAVDMRQDDAVAIDNPLSAGNRFDCPGLGKAAREGMAEDDLVAPQPEARPESIQAMIRQR
jgi:hypothetical protein